MIPCQRYSCSEIIINYAGFQLIGFIWIGLVPTWLKEAKGPDLKCQCERFWSVHQTLPLSLTPSSFTEKKTQTPSSFWCTVRTFDVRICWMEKNFLFYFFCCFFFSSVLWDVLWAEHWNAQTGMWAFDISPPSLHTPSLDHVYPR